MKNEALIVSIIDNSGSMKLILNDSIGGFNQFLEDQTAAAPDNKMTLVYFNSIVEPQFSNRKLSTVEKLSTSTYKTRGMTALYDAVGTTIDKVGAELANMAEADRPNKVVFAILTDGEENSSVEYTADKVKEMINHQRDKYNWDFNFLAASEQGLKDGHRMGIAQCDSYVYEAVAGKATKGFATLSKATTRSLS